MLSAGLSEPFRLCLLMKSSVRLLCYLGEPQHVPAAVTGTPGLGRAGSGVDLLAQPSLAPAQAAETR